MDIVKQIDLGVTIPILAALVATVVGAIRVSRWIREEVNRSYYLQLDLLRLEKLEKWLDICDTIDQISPKVENFLSSIDAHFECVSESLSNNSKSGEELYYSAELSEFRDVAHYYEKLASLVRLKLLEFDIVFVTLPFPDRWWQETSELRFLIKHNWFGSGQELEDFLENLEWLRNAYQNARRSR